MALRGIVQSVACLGFRLLEGLFRGCVEGNTILAMFSQRALSRRGSSVFRPAKGEQEDDVLEHNYIMSWRPLPTSIPWKLQSPLAFQLTPSGARNAAEWDRWLNFLFF